MTCEEVLLFDFFSFKFIYLFRVSIELFCTLVYKDLILNIEFEDAENAFTNLIWIYVTKRKQLTEGIRSASVFSYCNQGRWQMISNSWNTSR